MKNLFVKLILAFSILLFLSELVLAIPAFARKYNMSCATCHAPFPKLKPYGDEFAGNGFKLADQDNPRYYVNTGDDDLSLIRDFPIAVRLEGLVTYNNNNSEKSDFNAPYILKLLSGGEIAPNIAYYFYFFFSERGEVAGIEDAFIMFNNLFGSELDLYIGQFQVSDPLFKRELRLTFEDYLLYKNSIGHSRIDLTYDRGIMLTYGFDSGTDIIVEILNGSGIGEPDELRNFDYDPYKNVFGRLSQDIGEFLRIGGFGYYGKEDLEDGNNNSFTNETTMFGPDLTLSYNDMLELNFQYVLRKDKQPLSPTVLSAEVETKGMMGELIYTPRGDKSNWYAAALYNWQDSDLGGYKYSKVTGHLGWMLKRNVRPFCEFTYDLENKYGQVGLGIVSAF
ncbi:MAG: hypothetical protein H6612_00905 [Ignavibacteriales bacterium]|nr:hypothetical protein [Ignavibacteriales bacterium]